MGANVSTVHEIETSSPTKIINETPTTKGQVIAFHSSSKWNGSSTVHEIETSSPTKIINETPTTKGQVIAFHSSSKWKIHFESSKQTSKLIVMDFTASWCRPCQRIQPDIDEFAEIYTGVEFVKIDVDELHDVAREFGVQVMPTFILLKRGKEVDKVVGAKKEDLRNKIEKHRF